MKKINIAELLEDCSKGMKLYSPIFGEVYLYEIISHLAIVVTTDKEQGDFKEEFLYDGRYGMNGECMLFPSKENRDWNTFKVPFKEGDIIISKYNSIHILKSSDTSYIRLGSYLDTTQTTNVTPIRFASSEEKEKLFKAIKDNGYKWNPETKTLEKLIEPKFKVGNRIRNNKVDLGNIYTIIEVGESSYVVNKNNEHNNYNIDFVIQDDWELAPNKFDITTLKPFDKVLVRGGSLGKWHIDFFEAYNGIDRYPFSCIHNHYYNQCIPYKDNEHLLGTTDDCDEFYKTWE